MAGVHVIELILLWLVVFLASIWIPAAIDSFSTDFFASVAVLVATLVYWSAEGMISTAARIGLLAFLVPLTIAAAYIRLVQAVGDSRRRALAIVGSIATLGCAVVWGGKQDVILSKLHQAAGGVLELTNADPTEVKQYAKNLIVTVFLSETRAFSLDRAIISVSCVFAALVGIPYVLRSSREKAMNEEEIAKGGLPPFVPTRTQLAYSSRLGSSTGSRLSNEALESIDVGCDAPLLSPRYVIERVIHSFLVVVLVAVSVGSGMVVSKTIVGQGAFIGLREFSVLVGVLVGGTLLGALMDSKIYFHTHLLRVFGLRDLPVSQVGGEEEEDPLASTVNTRARSTENVEELFNRTTSGME